MDLTNVLDQGAGTLGIAACPDVIDEHVGALGKVTGPTGKDRTDIPRGPAALDHVVAEATEGVGLLATQVQVVMDDEGACHVTPLRDAPSLRGARSLRDAPSPGRVGRLIAGVWARLGTYHKRRRSCIGGPSGPSAP
jgi:hypothetical protein